MSELLKDLIEILLELHPAGDLIGSSQIRIVVEFGDGDGFALDPPTLAARLAALGYRKITECEKCRWWIPCQCVSCSKSESPVMECHNHDAGTMGEARREFDYCSEGEPKEGEEWRL